jgi:hypothetical protein
MVIVKNFVEQFIEGYILEDLETMSRDNVSPGKKYGAVGYPMIATILSGMELLGGFLTPNAQQFNPRGMRGNFLNYWDNYFVKEYPQYNGLGDIFYSLIRNGIGHVFIAKHGIVVNKFAGPAILVDQTKKELYLNPNEFYKEFRESYLNRAKPILDGSDTTTGLNTTIIGSRVNVLDADYLAESQAKFDSLGQLDSSVLTQDYWGSIGWTPQTTRSAGGATRSSGPSGPMGQVTNMSKISASLATTSINQEVTDPPNTPFTTIS